MAGSTGCARWCYCLFVQWVNLKQHPDGNHLRTLLVRMMESAHYYDPPEPPLLKTPNEAEENPVL